MIQGGLIRMHVQKPLNALVGGTQAAPLQFQIPEAPPRCLADTAMYVFTCPDLAQTESRLDQPQTTAGFPPFLSRHLRTALRASLSTSPPKKRPHCKVTGSERFYRHFVPGIALGNCDSVLRWRSCK